MFRLRPRFYPLRRRSRALVMTLLAIYLTLGVIVALSYYLDLSTKQIRTTFHDLERAFLEIPATLPSIRQYSSTAPLCINNRYCFQKKLGHGQEGIAQVWHDGLVNQEVVVKTYYSRKFRDFLPIPARQLFEDHAETWPAEVPAHLIVSALNPRNSDQLVLRTEDAAWRFVPVVDYFLLETNARYSTAYAWHVVMPFAAAGDLKTLGKQVGRDTQKQMKAANVTIIARLDQEFRPSFNRLMDSVKHLHDLGYCHSDIKPVNTMAFDRHNWVVGDLGNMRELDHPYYKTSLWMFKNQYTDCRLTDMRRLLKTYVTFLRSAAAFPTDFNQEFYAEKETWSAMYWAFVRHPSLDFEPSHFRPGERVLESGGQRASARRSIANTMLQFLLPRMAVRWELMCGCELNFGYLCL